MGFGRGGSFWDRGFGGGRGWRHGFWATGLPGWMRFSPPAGPDVKPDPQTEKQALKSQAEALQSELDFIKKRLGEIESETAAQ
jgi:hypothetical protein